MPSLLFICRANILKLGMLTAEFLFHQDATLDSSTTCCTMDSSFLEKLWLTPYHREMPWSNRGRALLESCTAVVMVQHHKQGLAALQKRIE